MTEDKSVNRTVDIIELKVLHFGGICEVHIKDVCGIIVSMASKVDVWSQIDQACLTTIETTLTN